MCGKLAIVKSDAMRSRRVAIGLLILVCSLACDRDVAVATGVDEAKANRIMVALGRHGIEGNKLSDESGAFDVLVKSDRVQEAIQVLEGKRTAERSVDAPSIVLPPPLPRRLDDPARRIIDRVT